MKTFLRSFALLILLGACAKKEVDDPRVELTDVGFTLHLPPAMQQALDSLAPEFHTVRTTSCRSDVTQATAAMGSGGMPAVFTAVGDFTHDSNPPVGVAGAFEVVAYPDSSIFYQYRNGGFQGHNIGN